MYSTQHTARARGLCVWSGHRRQDISPQRSQNQIYRSAHPTQIISHTPRLRALRPLRVILPLTLADLELDAMTR